MFAFTSNGFTHRLTFRGFLVFNVFDSCLEALRLFNPYVTNGFSHHYHLGESTFIYRGIRSDFSILFNFSIKIL